MSPARSTKTPPLAPKALRNIQDDRGAYRVNKNVKINNNPNSSSSSQKTSKSTNKPKKSKSSPSPSSDTKSSKKKSSVLLAGINAAVSNVYKNVRAKGKKKKDRANANRFSPIVPAAGTGSGSSPETPPTTQKEPENTLDSDFIAFDEDFSDAAASIHTTFKAFEDEMSLFDNSDSEGYGDNANNDNDNNNNSNTDSDDDVKDGRKRRTRSNEDEKLSKRGEEGAGSSRKRKRAREDSGREEWNAQRTGASSSSSSSSSEFPWVVDHDHSNEEEIADWLTLEIKDFVDYMSPSAAEITARNNAVQSIRKVVKNLWQDADIHVFGSFATDLYLPGSDIDMVILSKGGMLDTKSNLFLLSSALRRNGLVKPYTMEVVAKARVPIIKFVEASSNIPIDISFEKRNGVAAVQLIRNWVQEFPCIRYFAIIIKHFLARRKMNEVHTGGLGGFTVICLIVSFLKNHPRVATGSIDPMSNLGVLLIEFFEFYGKNFNYDALALSMSGDMKYLRKERHRALQPKVAGKMALAVQDPSDAENNLSGGSFNIRAIKKAFSGAFDLLAARCYELESLTSIDKGGKSILGNVIKFLGPERDFVDSRSEVRSEYELNIESYTSFNEGESPQGDDSSEDIVVPSDFEEDESDDKKTTTTTSNASATTAIEYYNISDSDSDSEAAPGGSASAPITFDSDDEEDDDESEEEDSRVSTVDKTKKREYWSSKAAAAAN